MLRWLIGILVVLNLVLFLLIRMDSRPPEPPPPQPMVESDDPLPSLWLLDEVAQGQIDQRTNVSTQTEEMPAEDPARAAVEQPVAETVTAGKPAVVDTATARLEQGLAEPIAPAIPPAAVTAMICGHAGPFDTRDAATELIEVLSRAGGIASIESSTIQRTKGYWVLIPQLPDTAAAKQMVTRLQDAGIKDLWLIPAGDMRNAISLGMFDSIDNAKRRVAQLAAKGFKTVFEPRTGSAEAFAVSFSRVPAEAWDSMKNRQRGWEVTAEPCRPEVP